MSATNPRADEPGTEDTRSLPTTADRHGLGDVQVTAGGRSAYLTVELIVYLIAVFGIFLTAAIAEDDDMGGGFGASQAWYYVTLLTIGFLISRGLARIDAYRDNRVL